VKELHKDKILKQVGLRISKTRIKLGISRYQLAFEVGTSEKHIRQIEGGEINTGIFKIYLIAEALGKKPEDFLK
jgi:transcriptional regulator with XRE-family HTH domain